MDNESGTTVDRESTILERASQLERQLSFLPERLWSLHRRINGKPESKENPEKATPGTLEELFQRMFSHINNIDEAVGGLEQIL